MVDVVGQSEVDGPQLVRMAYGASTPVSRNTLVRCRALREIVDPQIDTSDPKQIGLQIDSLLRRFLVWAESLPPARKRRSARQALSITEYAIVVGRLLFLGEGVLEVETLTQRRQTAVDFDGQARIDPRRIDRDSTRAWSGFARTLRLYLVEKPEIGDEPTATGNRWILPADEIRQPEPDLTFLVRLRNRVLLFWSRWKAQQRELARQELIRRRANHVFMLRIPGGLRGRTAWRVKAWFRRTRKSIVRYKRSMIALAVLVVILVVVLVFKYPQLSSSAPFRLTNSQDPVAVLMQTSPTWSAVPGPPRKLYDFGQQAPTAPEFNSTLSRAFGPTWDFVGVSPQHSLTSIDNPLNEVDVSPGKLYRVEVYIENTSSYPESDDPNYWIDDAHLRIGMLTEEDPDYILSFQYEVFARLTGSNVSAVWDGVEFRIKRGQYLTIVPKSIRLVDQSHPGGVDLGEQALSGSGQSLDFDNLGNGIPPGPGHAMYVTFEVQASY